MANLTDVQHGFVFRVVLFVARFGDVSLSGFALFHHQKGFIHFLQTSLQNVMTDYENLREILVIMKGCWDEVEKIELTGCPYLL